MSTAETLAWLCSILAVVVLLLAVVRLLLDIEPTTLDRVPLVGVFILFVATLVAI